MKRLCLPTDLTSVDAYGFMPLIMICICNLESEIVGMAIIHRTSNYKSAGLYSQYKIQTVSPCNNLHLPCMDIGEEYRRLDSGKKLKKYPTFQSGIKDNGIKIEISEPGLKGKNDVLANKGVLIKRFKLLHFSFLQTPMR